MTLKIWTDGGCNPNPGTGGWGWVRSDGVEDCGGELDTTNNRMEMTAIIEALSKLPDGQKVVVYSDSQYCIKGLTIWHRGWKAKNWMKKGEPMINRDLWLALHKQTQRLNASFEWVKGHNGHAMNERADDLAGRGVCAAQSQKTKHRPVKANKTPKKPVTELVSPQADDLDMLILAFRDLKASVNELMENFDSFEKMIARVAGTNGNSNSGNEMADMLANRGRGLVS